MKCKYYYIDDNVEEANNASQGLRVPNQIEITVSKPQGHWEAEFDILNRQGLSQYSGLILDLRFNEFEGIDGSKAKYNGITLAQELRTLAKQNDIEDIPIILLSAEKYIESSLDQTGADLFDLKIPKGTLTSDKFIQLRPIIISLSEGYKQIKAAKEKSTVSEFILTLLNIETKEIDFRLVERLTILQSLPSHILSTFIIDHLLNRSGILISEALLASKLGVDYKTSTDWVNLLNIIKNTEYSGVFSLGWQRWWNNHVENWYESMMENSNDNFLSLTANERIKILKTNLKLEHLNPIIKLNKAESSVFTMICKGSGYPIAKEDALLLSDQDNLFSWEDREYISIEEALSPQRILNNWSSISILEEDRLSYLKQKNIKIRERK